ncbi:SRPBCC family protein [Thalassomonas actiniarum]|uniref:SRPBCC family protein n=1 Tax=Thalassomonas actiniarum TaxID=485447 RepID=A0AAE9YY76_9GAMM|nr:SRPBCC family protein [Thalassomonas actiniarum]WDE02615.1 SRPBCC family protein [Thalassomonas actiniarum]
MLKKIALVIVTIIAIPLVMAIFVKTSYDVEREVVINKPKDQVFNYIRFLKNQNEFSKWANIDPNMTKSYRGIDGEVGFVSAWDSQHEEVGTGEQEIVAIQDGHRIDFELRFLKPFEATEPAYMITEDVSGNQTKVKWGFSGHMDYPMNLMFLFMDFEKIIGDDLQTGLDNLKEIQESQ